MLVRQSKEVLGHPILDNIGAGISAVDLADYAFAGREKLYRWVVQQSENLIRWDIERLLSKLSVWLWVTTILGWVPFYLLRWKPVLMIWFVLPTVALVVSLLRAPLTAEGKDYIQSCASQFDSGFDVAVRGLKAVATDRPELKRFLKVFRFAYRGREMLKMPRNTKP